MSELDKMSAFVESGESEILSAFYDWMMANGFRFTRWEQRSKKTACPSPLCEDGMIRHRNPDPYIGWTTRDLPEFIEVECTRCEGQGYLIKYEPEDWHMYLGGPEQLFAMYAGIDLKKLDEERHELLRQIREKNDAG